MTLLERMGGKPFTPEQQAARAKHAAEIEQFRLTLKTLPVGAIFRERWQCTEDFDDTSGWFHYIFLGDDPLRVIGIPVRYAKWDPESVDQRFFNVVPNSPLRESLILDGLLKMTRIA